MRSRTYTVGMYAQIAGSIRQEFDDKDGRGGTALWAEASGRL